MSQQDHDLRADPNISRLQKILRIVEGLRIDPKLKDYDDRYEAQNLLHKALQAAVSKHHQVRKLTRALRAKDRRMLRYSGRGKP